MRVYTQHNNHTHSNFNDIDSTGRPSVDIFSSDISLNYKNTVQ